VTQVEISPLKFGVLFPDPAKEAAGPAGSLEAMAAASPKVDIPRKSRREL